jgi:acetylornithine/succinyldiaminopimelate/putrescine aminotransferase
VAQAIGVGEHGSTFAGGPLVCAVAQSVFDRISSPQFLADVRDKGEYLHHRLLQLPGKIKEVCKVVYCWMDC